MLTLISTFQINRALFLNPTSGKHLEQSYGEASFKNFISYVIDKIKSYEDCTTECKPIDPHWKPFYLQCAYCDVDYNFIGRMETFENDVR